MTGKFKEGMSQILVINQDDPLTFAQDAVLGQWELIEDGDLFKATSSTAPGQDKKNPTSLESQQMPLSEGLQELYSRTSEGLSKSQRRMLHGILWEHQEAFTLRSHY